MLLVMKKSFHFLKIKFRKGIRGKERILIAFDIKNYFWMLIILSKIAKKFQLSLIYRKFRVVEKAKSIRKILFKKIN